MAYKAGPPPSSIDTCTSFDVKLQMYIRDGPAGSVRSARAASLSGAGRRF